ncbi:glycerophosphodiester phosphodiesterase [candidate division CSSED10-310 bacterium]|uniref:Glycerophosphodiester phosphodiesterase n=1 Tax=candidate division CSSED10-310 bacterium TaxID=2855610 RepID=A0ABV6YSL2_UNCC1
MKSKCKDPDRALVNPLIIAHRGAAGSEIENTMSAFERAVAEGADMLEMDIHLSAEGVPLVFHDLTLDRLLNQERTISEISLRELKNISFNTGETIPLLEEVLDTFGHRIKLDLELKEKKCLAPVIRLIQEKKLVQQVILTSFDTAVVLRATQLCSELKTGLIMGRRTWDPLIRLKEVFPLIDLLRSKARCLILHYSLAHSLLRNVLHLLGYQLYLWTSLEDEFAINSQYFKRCLELNVDGIATIWPAQLKQFKS